MLRKLYRTWHTLMCGQPIPDDLFIWWRCQYGCPWCDYMQKWWAERNETALRPPYR